MNTSDIKKLVLEYQDYVVHMRREFHRHPETSDEEYHTREVLVREIESMNVPYKLLKGTGIIAIIQGGKPGKHRVIRSDIDGLPVQEETENLRQKKVCVSNVEGVSHTCGHDAHMAMLLGTMKVLLKLQDEIEGTVYCCFEEGEETGCGVDTMLEALKEYPIEECFVFHVNNNLTVGKVNVVPGPRMAGTVGIGFYVKGKGGHGSRPDHAANPIVPAAHIITQIDSAFLNQLNAEQTVTLGLCKFQAGVATNVIPDQAYVGGTARYFDKEEGEKALHIINMIAENTAACHKCTVEFEVRNKIFLPPAINDEEVALKVQAKVGEICGNDVLADCNKGYGSETYARYLERYRGALGYLGIRNEAYGSGEEHHNGRFDIDESVLPLGVCTEVGFVFTK